tara:strand:- start:5315 stop:5959 length:645 start_codon:yes stop_codon:yes gene_type:complete
MKRNKILFIFSLFFAFSASVLGQTSLKAKKLLDDTSAKISSYKNYQFDFNYSLDNTIENISQETKGEVIVADKNYKLITPDLIQLFDGKNLYTIIPDNEEVLITKPDQSDIEILNPTKLIEIYETGYDFHWDILQNVRGNKIQYIKLIPTEESPDISYILLGINLKSYDIHKLIEVGKQRTTTTLIIQNFTTNNNLSSDSFIFNKDDYPGFYIN